MKTRLPKFGSSAIFDDVAQMANGAASALGELRSDIKSKMQGRAARAKSAMRHGMDAATPKSSGQTQSSDTVPRKDFEAALARITALGERIAALEAQLATKTAPKRKPAKKAPKKSSPNKA